MVHALEISNLSKSFQDFRLENISFMLPAGCIMGLIGPNGAGKTTVIKLILNLLHPEAGSITLFGLDHRAAEVEARSRIGFVHEVPHFYEHVSLAALKSIVAPFYATWDEEQFRGLISRFDLPLKKRFGKLSRGMKMKFSLALALSHHADLLILDEPTSGLDPVSRSELLDILLAFIQDESKSVLFSTQITSDLERIADCITFILDGRLVFSRSRDEVMEKWRLVRGDLRLLPDPVPSWIKGVRRHEFGFEALTDDEAEARRCLGAGSVVEKVGLDDIIFFLIRGENHA